jgi:hypothetical protein
MSRYSRVLKVVIDAPPSLHDQELAFWQGALGQELPEIYSAEYHGAFLRGSEVADTGFASSVLSAEFGTLVVRVTVSLQVGRAQVLRPVSTLARVTYSPGAVADRSPAAQASQLSTTEAATRIRHPGR